MPKLEPEIAVHLGPGGEGVAAVASAIELAATDDAEATVGRLEELAAYVGRYLAHFGVEPGEGEVITSGSTVPLIDVAAGESWRSEVAGVGAVAVRLD